jgi:hypothetical protein
MDGGGGSQRGAAGDVIGLVPPEPARCPAVVSTGPGLGCNWLRLGARSRLANDRADRRVTQWPCCDPNIAARLVVQRSAGTRCVTCVFAFPAPSLTKAIGCGRTDCSLSVTLRQTGVPMKVNRAWFTVRLLRTPPRLDREAAIGLHGNRVGLVSIHPTAAEPPANGMVGFSSNFGIRVGGLSRNIGWPPGNGTGKGSLSRGPTGPVAL